MGIKIFKDLLVYRLTQPVDAFKHYNLTETNDALATKVSRQPGSQELGTFGFVDPVGEEDAYIEELTDGALLITAQQWKRDLPASVVNRELAIKVRKVEDEEGRKVYAKEKRQLKDEIVMALLPRAFIKGKRVSALIKDHYIFIDTSSAKLAEQLLSLLRETLGSLPVRPVSLKTNPVATMTEWLRQGDEGSDIEDFRLGESFQAKGAQEEASTLSGKCVDLSEDDIRQLLDTGRQVTQLGLGFQDHNGQETIYFTLTEDLTLKGIQWPDAFADQATRDAGEDADWITTYRATLLLISDAMGRLFDALVPALGGEDLGQESAEAFETRMLKAAKDIAKNMKSFKLGDTNLATDFPLAALEQADNERQPCADGEHTYLGNSKTGAITPKCVDCGHDRTADDEADADDAPFEQGECAGPVVDDNEDLI